MAAGRQIVPELAPEAIQTELEKILASSAFASSEQLRGFLRFTVEKTLCGERDRIKEFLVGVEVFGRGESFDPRTDNIVRAQAGKLRSRLETYYASEGLHDEVLIEYPKGSYAPVFRRLERLAEAPPAVPRRRNLRLPAALFILVGIAGYLLWRWPRPADPVGPSVVVLPFVDMSPDKDQEYFCDGITEELINSLAKLGGLRVVARTSAFAFKGKGEDVRKIGDQLKVRAVLEGSVRKSGDRLRVTAQLNDVANGYHLWSETYDRELKDVFAIQDEISQAIVKVLQVKLGRGQAQPLIQRYPLDPEAYDLYLKGRQSLNTASAESLKIALDCFRQALARNPAFAPAQAAVAETYYWMTQRSVMAPKDAFPRAKEAAQKALALDERSAEAHASLAAALYAYDWDWPAADREFRRALELSPNLAAVHQTYSRYLTTVARKDDALREMRRAEELDPLSLSIKQNFATLFIIRREFDRSIEKCRAAIAIDPAYYMAYANMGTAMFGAHWDREALDALWQGWTLSAHRDPMALTWLGYVVGATGDRVKAEALLADLRELSKQRYIRPVFLALFYAGLGDAEQAFLWLDRSCADRDVQLSFLRQDYQVDRLRSDPRFDALMKRLNLP